MFETSANELTWFLVGLVLLLGEFIIPGFVIFFFGIGAWIVAVLLWINVDISFTSQLFIFLLSSGITLVLFRRYGKEYFQGKISQKGTTAFEEIKGERATVVYEIRPDSNDGKVEFHGTQWRAESDSPIPKGAVVEVVSRNNITLKVQPLSKE